MTVVNERHIYGELMTQVDALAAQWANEVDIFVDGGPQPDLQSRGTKPFASVKIEVESQKKKSIEAGKGLQRFYGSVMVGVYYRPDEGPHVAMSFMDDVRDRFCSVMIGNIIMGDAHNSSPLRIPGWFNRGSQFLFEVDRLPL